jgi:CheY-like chemotaxis protein/DNA-binding XRE family transcriptional regulator
MAVVDVRKRFGGVVRAHRLRLGFSQEGLAERAKLHRTYVTDVERGARNLSLESISRLAQALRVPMGALFLWPETPHTQPNHFGHSINILLVEDDPKDVKLTQRAFAQAKLANRLETVRDGAAALDYLFCRGRFSKRHPKTVPHVVLLDLHLPKVNGLEVLRAIRANELTRAIHVVVLTSSDGDAHFREALYLGANGYIIKPIDFRNFSAVTPKLNFAWALLKQESTG